MTNKLSYVIYSITGAVVFIFLINIASNVNKVRNDTITSSVKALPNICKDNPNATLLINGSLLICDNEKSDIGSDIGSYIGSDIGSDIGLNIGSDIGLNIGSDIPTD